MQTTKNFLRLHVAFLMDLMSESMNLVESRTFHLSTLQTLLFGAIPQKFKWIIHPAQPASMLISLVLIILGNLTTTVDIDRRVLTLHQNFVGSCSNVKFSSTGSVKDSDGLNSWNIKVPLSDCSITSNNTKVDSLGNTYTEHALYLNSQLSDTSPLQQLVQIGQLKLVCRVDSFQVSFKVL